MSSRELGMLKSDVAAPVADGAGQKPQRVCRMLPVVDLSGAPADVRHLSCSKSAA